jgi:hypothetical protein
VTALPTRMARCTGVVVALIGGGALLLSGCAAATSPAPGEVTASTPVATTGDAVPTAPSALEHVHNLGLEGATLLIGSHEGLWEQQSGGVPRPRAEVVFDVMGLARDGDRWLASGHPGADMEAPGNLGLRESRDGGTTWSEVSLSGEVDFHRLVAAGDTVMGMSAGDGKLLRSADDGKTWQDLGSPPLFDLAIDPDSATIVIGTTPDGPVRSTDGGATFVPITGAPLLALLGWDTSAFIGISSTGQVHRSIDAGVTWTALGTLEGPATALAVSSEAVVALVGDTIVESTDGGMTFAPRLRGVGVH